MDHNAVELLGKFAPAIHRLNQGAGVSAGDWDLGSFGQLRRLFVHSVGFGLQLRLVPRFGLLGTFAVELGGTLAAGGRRGVVTQFADPAEGPSLPGVLVEATRRQVNAQLNRMVDMQDSKSGLFSAG